MSEHPLCIANYLKASAYRGMIKKRNLRNNTSGALGRHINGGRGREMLPVSLQLGCDLGALHRGQPATASPCRLRTRTECVRQK